ncbi:hypothetical protein PBI_NEBKISS_51 [Mycobacterium phage Nebkiss]|nr:hypothetical protein PBI_NEBKISS_51 [Mycobacterium phage Nebkiss]
MCVRRFSLLLNGATDELDTECLLYALRSTLLARESGRMDLPMRKVYDR